MSLRIQLGVDRHHWLVGSGTQATCGLREQAQALAALAATTLNRYAALTASGRVATLSSTKVAARCCSTARADRCSRC
jgi:hypothetical protein